jgi:uncharacterized protein with HEPN domain
MQLETRKLLLDMLEAVSSIEEFTKGRTFADLARDKLLRSGISYQFVVIGEAISQLRRIDQTTFDGISESSRIVGFRNQIIHGYGFVKDNVTWQVIQDKLPILKRELADLLAR